MMRIEAPLQADFGVFLDVGIVYPYVFCEPGGGSPRYELLFDVEKGTLYLKDKVDRGNVYITNRPSLDSDVKSGDATLNSVEYQKRQKQVYYESFYDVLPALFEGSGFVSSTDEVGEVVLFKTRELPKSFVSLVLSQSADRYNLLADYLGTSLKSTIRTVQNVKFIDRCFSNAAFGKISGSGEREIIFPIDNNKYYKNGKAGFSMKNLEQYLPYIPIYEEIYDDIGVRPETIGGYILGGLLLFFGAILTLISGTGVGLVLAGAAIIGATAADPLRPSNKRLVEKRPKNDTFSLELEYDFLSVKGVSKRYYYGLDIESVFDLTQYTRKKDIKLYFADKTNYDLYLNEKPSFFVHPAMYLPSRDDDSTQYLYTNKPFTQSGTLNNLNYRFSIDVKRTRAGEFGFYKLPVGIKTYTNYFGDSFNDNNIPMSYLASEIIEIGVCSFYFGDEYPSTPRLVTGLNRSFVIDIPRGTTFLRISSPEVIIQCIVAFNKDKSIADAFEPFYLVDAEDDKNLFTVQEIPSGFLYVCNDARLLPRKIIIIR